MSALTPAWEHDLIADGKALTAVRERLRQVSTDHPFPDPVGAFARELVTLIANERADYAQSLTRLQT